MKQLVLAFLLATSCQLTISAQQIAKSKDFKTTQENPDFTINDLYTPQQLLNLETVAPDKLLEIKSFFQTWDALSTAVKSNLNKRDLYRLYVRDRESFDLKLTLLAD